MITNPIFIKELKELKRRYADLPWYQRFWFRLCSYKLSSALFALTQEQPTQGQVENLVRASKSAWFFKSIFGILEQFNQAVHGIPFFIKESCLQQVPEEVLDFNLSSKLSNQDLIGFIRSSQSHAALFQPLLDVRKFLHQVTRGEYEAVEAMLKRDITLLSKKGLVTDSSERVFSNISGFEYALWALDKHMWTRMLNCIPKDEQSKNIIESLSVQYKKIKKNGVTYTLNGQRIARCRPWKVEDRGL